MIQDLPGDMKTDNIAIRDKLAKREGSPYHETSEARIIAFKNGWDACLANEPLGKLIKSWGEIIVEKGEWKEECQRLAKVAEFWQSKYNELNNEKNKHLPGFYSGKIDNL
jgi:hypothetical protein